MTGDPRDLRTIQQWMQAVITHPGGVVAGFRSPDARQRIDVPPDEAERVVTRSRALDPIRRLEIYANAYYARLLECLREEFPAFVRAVGEEVFDGFAFGYLQSYPPRSYTLAALGADFPRYLRETRPQKEETAPDWTDFLVDLATLERIYSEVFDGPGVEGERLLDESDLRSISPEDWPRCRLVLAECLRLAEFRFPVHEYATAVRRNEAAEIPAPRPTWLAITRREFIVRRAPLTYPQYVLLAALSQGANVGEGLERAASVWEGEIEQLAAEVGAWFHEWAQIGHFRRIELPESRG